MRSPLAALRRPEYTGDNRCWPCTALNVAILLGGCLVLMAFSPLVAVLTALVGGAVIWTRGYLLPYTPEIAPTFASWLPFDGPTSGQRDRSTRASLSGTNDEELGEELVLELLDAGILVEDGELLRLDEEFRSLWRAEMETIRELDTPALVEAIEATAPMPVEVEVLGEDRMQLVLTGPGGDEEWLALPIAVAEVAAARSIERVAPRLSEQLRSAAIRPLRAFLEECPLCETPVIETSPNHCCGGVRDPSTAPDAVLACPDCDRRLYTLPPTEPEPS